MRDFFYYTILILLVCIKGHGVPCPYNVLLWFMHSKKMKLVLVFIMLGNFGYDVTAVVDGIEVIDEYKTAMTSGCPYDAVIMDLTIPGGMGAKETISILKDLDPKVKAVISSGYSNDPIVNEYSDHGFKGAIIKPYGLKELIFVINSVVVGSI